MNLSEAASKFSPSFDIVAKHQFQRCACGCGQLVNRTWAKGHCNRLQAHKQTKQLQIHFSAEDYARLKQDAAERGMGMATLLRELWRKECGR